MKSYSEPELRMLYIYLSGSCNLLCRHCWIEPDNESQLRIPKLSELQKTIEGAVPLGLRAVKISGGEPLMSPILPGLIEWLNEKDIPFILETNATLVDSEFAEKLKNAPIIKVAVSLDAHQAEPHDILRGKSGSFEKALSGIRALKEVGVNIEIVFSLWCKNAELLKESVLFASREGASSFKINIISEYNRARAMREEGLLPDIKEILELRSVKRDVEKESEIPVHMDLPPAFLTPSEIRRGGFCSIKNILGITSSGDFTICGIGERCSNIRLGNISEYDVGKVWKKSPRLEQIRKELPENLEGICSMCFYRDICLGKCRAVSLYESGDIFSEFPFCSRAYEQGLFPENLVI